MRTKVYQFSELDATAQKKALEQFRTIQVDYEWWDSEYDYFHNLMSAIGIDVDLKQTYFKGFWSQGDGAAITADIDLKKLVEGIAGKVWEKEYGEAVTKELDFRPCEVNKRVLQAIYNGAIDCTIKLKARTQHSYSTALEFEHDVYDSHPLIYKELNNLEIWLEGIESDVSGFLYKTLEKQYEYLTSDEAVKEAIEANEYWFTKEGQQWG